MPEGPGPSDDPYNLERFVQAQAIDYSRALQELQAGKKQSHWMWYIFPQFEGLGRSARSQRFSIKTVLEARAYLDHAILGPRLRECITALLNVTGRSALEILGSPDHLKLHSCATLFHSVSHDPFFAELLQKYFKGEPDPETLRIMGS